MTGLVTDKIVELYRQDNTMCTIHLHGATITSWRVRNLEQLYLSRAAIFDNTKHHITGGVPIIFPQFGEWAFGPDNGFAASVLWTVEQEPTRLHNRDVETILSLTDNDCTRSIWNYQFYMTYKVTLKEKELVCDISVKNMSCLNLTFNLMLQTYFRIPPDVCLIIGLDACSYEDRSKNNKIFVEDRDAIYIDKVTDRVYQNAPNELIIYNKKSGTQLYFLKTNFPDTHVWNPWIEESKDIPNFDDDEYARMICVSAGCISNQTILKPSDTFEGSLKFQLLI